MVTFAALSLDVLVNFYHRVGMILFHGQSIDLDGNRISKEEPGIGFDRVIGFAWAANTITPFWF